jgi:hypothetical protein
MVLRVAVGLASLLVVGCARTTPVAAPTVVFVGGVSGSALESSYDAPEHGGAWKARDEVEVEWHGQWWPAIVLEKRGPRWMVHYEGYASDWDEAVAGDRIRERRAEPEVDSGDDWDEEPDP